MKLKNKIAYVVGGNGFLGSDIVNKLRLNGAKVLVLDIKFNTLIKNNSVKFEKFDLSKINSIEKILKRIIQKHGCPDIFVNASYPRTKSWNKSDYKNLTVSELNKNITMHLNSFVWSSMKICEIMKASKKKGSIIIINSIYGVLGQNKRMYKKTNINLNPVYAAIKGGLLTFIKNLSSFYGQDGIRANSIVCGGIRGHIAGTKNKLSKKFVKKYSSNTLLNRMGEPEDISSAVLYLASGDSSYVTGTELIVDGGYLAI